MKTTQTAGAAFDVSPEGFRALNADRKPAILVKELVQNSLDAEPAKLDVSVKWDEAAKAVRLSVRDDAPGGVRDLSLIWTLYATDKHDAPTKRGRMGRGLKEIISVADETRIATVKGLVVFRRDAKGKWSRHTEAEHRLSGTVVDMTFRTAAWTAQDADDIAAFLRTVIPPTSVALAVNGEPVPKSMPVATHRLSLFTVTFVGGVERKVPRACDVHLHTPPSGGKAVLYEMGIPIQDLDCPLSVDVQQRVPMNPHRDVVSVQWLRSLYAQILNERAGEVPEDAVGSQWVMEAAQAQTALTTEAKSVIAAHYTKGAALAANRAEMRDAENHHVSVVLASNVPAAVRPIVREMATPAGMILADLERASAKPIPKNRLTKPQARLVRVWEFVATKAAMPCEVRVAEGKVRDRLADYGTGTLTVYAGAVSKAFFNDPIGVPQLDVLGHELTHWDSTGHEHVHGAEFHSDATNVCARIARALYDHHDDIAAMLKEA